MGNMCIEFVLHMEKKNLMVCEKHALSTLEKNKKNPSYLQGSLELLKGQLERTTEMNPKMNFPSIDFSKHFNMQVLQLSEIMNVKQHLNVHKHPTINDGKGNAELCSYNIIQQGK